MLTPLILRLLVAYAVGSLAYLHFGHGREAFAKDLEPRFKNNATQLVKIGAVIESVIAAFLVVGFYTQIAGLLAAILFAKILYFRKQYKNFGIESGGYYWVLLILSLTVFLSGAGPFAFDLPL